MRERGLHTVCEEAACPNIYECWEARGGDVPSLRRSLHAPLRLLRRDDRQAAAARPGGAGEDRRGRSADGPEVRGHHRRRSRRSATTAPRLTGPTTVRAVRERDARLRHRGAHPRLQGPQGAPTRLARTRDRGAARRPGAQPRDRATAPPEIRPGFGYDATPRASCAGRRSSVPTR